MPNLTFNTEQLPVELGDGLVLRRGRADDAAAVADFNAMIQSDEGPDKPDELIWAWTHDLMAHPHPTFKPEYCTIVEDTATGKIVSTMNLIPQTWRYAGIPFKLGRPELVGTLPEYRKRGLVRLQFEVIHRWSAENGDKVQAITGIPYYYRQFGYEMALNLGGGRLGYPIHIPRLKEGEKEPYQLREATEADIPLLMQLSGMCDVRSLVSCAWDESLWRYELKGMSKKNVHREEVRIIERADGQACGMIAHPPHTWGETMVLQWYEILPECAWLDITPSVIRYLERAHAELPAPHGEKKPFGAFGFWLGEEHPVYHALADKLPRQRKPYAWYLRVADVADFLRLVRPALEKRLANSAMAGYSGELMITFYRSGVRMVIEKGQLVTVEEYQPHPYGHQGGAGFPPHTFLQLLFGYRSIEQLKASYADIWTDKDEYHALLEAMFPHQVSDLWPVA